MTLDASINVKEIMDTWTLQMGYPLVTLTREPSTNKVTVTQKWFLLNPQNTVQNTDEYKKYRWYIPFTYTSQSEQNWELETPPTWFKPDAQESKTSKKDLIIK